MGQRSFVRCGVHFKPKAKRGPLEIITIDHYCDHRRRRHRRRRPLDQRDTHLNEFSTGNEVT